MPASEVSAPKGFQPPKHQPMAKAKQMAKAKAPDIRTVTISQLPSGVVAVGGPPGGPPGGKQPTPKQPVRIPDVKSSNFDVKQPPKQPVAIAPPQGHVERPIDRLGERPDSDKVVTIRPLLENDKKRRLEQAAVPPLKAAKSGVTVSPVRQSPVSTVKVSSSFGKKAAPVATNISDGKATPADPLKKTSAKSPTTKALQPETRQRTPPAKAKAKAILGGIAQAALMNVVREVREGASSREKRSLSEGKEEAVEKRAKVVSGQPVPIAPVRPIAPIRPHPIAPIRPHTPIAAVRPHTPIAAVRPHTPIAAVRP
eukprot:Platyproteum_vivax@DN10741_c0_g1_i1.p1